MLNCPLCGINPESWVDSFFRCPQCHLTFQASYMLPEIEKEKARYKLHKNNIDDSGYVSWLNDFLEKTVIPFSDKGTKGLDFGCGPGPVLSQLMKRKGFNWYEYDPLFYYTEMPENNAPYQLITLTEVVEHFHRPSLEFKRLFDLLAPGGYLSIMTNFSHYWENPDDFLNWWYVKDFTHVSFYRESTFKWIASHWGFEVVYLADGNKVVLRKLTT